MVGSIVNNSPLLLQMPLCQDSWEALLSHSPATQKLWSQLSRKMWLQRCISTTVSNASLYDLLFLVTYIFAHPKLSVAGQNLFTVVAVQFIPSFIVSVGGWLQQLAIHKARERLQALPILKGKAGQARKICDPVNRLLLLFKLRKQKQHRLTIAETHNDDLGVANSRMMWFEAYVDTLLHASALESAFSDSRQICICLGSQQLWWQRCKCCSLLWLFQKCGRVLAKPTNGTHQSLRDCRWVGAVC